MKPRLRLSWSAAATADARVLWVGREADRPVLLGGAATPAGLRALTALAALQRAAGERGRAIVIPAADGVRWVLAGLGAREEWQPATIERAMAAAARAAGRAGAQRLAAPLAPPRDRPLEPARLAEALVFGAWTGTYEASEFRAPPRPGESRLGALQLTGSPTAAQRRAAAAGQAAGDVLEMVRDVANRPGNAAGPSAIERAVRALARRFGVGCEVLSAERLRRQGCGALLAVGRGSHDAPRLILLRHAGRRRGAPVALVGKTITFDSGGLSLKTRQGMETMKYDKCGGMAALAAVLLAARLDLPVPVLAVLPVAENLPGGGATRPGDIVRARTGKTIEVLNTDAEGRLILADALSLAADARPRAIVDLATLTGAVVTALGHRCAAVLGTDEALIARLRAAGERVGERLWPLPLWPDYDEDLRSPFADLKNIGDGSAGTIVGAAFLKAFVPAGVPWAHLDIAGVAHHDKATPHAAAGATLFGARLLLDWLRELSDRDER